MNITHAQLHRTLSVALTALLLITMGLLTFLLSLRITQLSKEEGAYNRYTSCVLSVPALDRDKTKIEQCWESVQEEVDFQIKRYDK